jgi:hypothetical protein
MLEANRRAIIHAIEDVTNSDDLEVKFALAVEWIDWYRQRTSAGYIRETPPHMAKQIVRRPKPDPVLIPGEADITPRAEIA